MVSFAYDILVYWNYRTQIKLKNNPHSPNQCHAMHLECENVNQLKQKRWKKNIQPFLDETGGK
jgi:hypothetical protein